jgi:hypothetical protein
LLTYANASDFRAFGRPIVGEVAEKMWGKNSFLTLTQSGRLENQAQLRLRKPSDHPAAPPATHPPEQWATPWQLQFQAERRTSQGLSRGLAAGRP